jgi:hypothetical protein
VVSEKCVASIFRVELWRWRQQSCQNTGTCLPNYTVPHAIRLKSLSIHNLSLSNVISRWQMSRYWRSLFYFQLYTKITDIWVANVFQNLSVSYVNAVWAYFIPGVDSFMEDESCVFNKISEVVSLVPIVYCVCTSTSLSNGLDTNRVSMTDRSIGNLKYYNLQESRIRNVSWERVNTDNTITNQITYTPQLHVAVFQYLSQCILYTTASCCCISASVAMHSLHTFISIFVQHALAVLVQNLIS